MCRYIYIYIYIFIYSYIYIYIYIHIHIITSYSNIIHPCLLLRRSRAIPARTFSVIIILLNTIYAIIHFCFTINIMITRLVIKLYTRFIASAHPRPGPHELLGPALQRAGRRHLRRGVGPGRGAHPHLVTIYYIYISIDVCLSLSLYIYISLSLYIYIYTSI